MPGIKVSKTLFNKLPDREKELGKPAVINKLWQKSNKKCYLCDRVLNRASDDIVADHDETEQANGQTTLSNLNLVHRRCNSKKKGHKTEIMRPILRFEAFIEDKDKNTFSEAICFPGFSVTAAESVITVRRQNVEFEFPDGSKAKSPLYSETTKTGKTFTYCFVNAPIASFANDTDVQPRNIKAAQLRKIYLDLLENPLHEPPSCRVKDGPSYLRLFDGQHKAIASLLHNRTHVAAKVYIDLSREDATHLVNSIQSKVPKLKLSPLEAMYKMDTEWHDKFERHFDTNPDGSEDSFIRSLNTLAQPRARASLKDAIIKSVIDQLDDDAKQLALEHVTETILYKKMVEPLVLTRPLTMPNQEGQLVRDREAALVKDLVETLIREAFGPKKSAETDEKAKCRISRCKKQAALLRITSLVSQAIRGNFDIEDKDSLGTPQLKAAQRKQCGKIVKNVLSHPAWRESSEHSEKMRQFDTALSMNQNFAECCSNVGISVAFAKTGDVDDYWSD